MMPLLLFFGREQKDRGSKGNYPDPATAVILLHDPGQCYLTRSYTSFLAPELIRNPRPSNKKKMEKPHQRVYRT